MSVKLEFKENFSLKPYTTLKIGGKARYYVECRTLTMLKRALIFGEENHLPVYILGGGSNLLVDNNDIEALVIKLKGSDFDNITIDGDCVNVGAGVILAKFLQFLLNNKFTGLEFLSGIPSATVGGSIFMNAGSGALPYWIGNFIKDVTVLNKKNETKKFHKSEIDFKYRKSNIDGIILNASFLLKKDKQSDIKKRMQEYLATKKKKQVLDMPSAGSIFKNDPQKKWFAAELIEKAGLKGKSIGGAIVSLKHSNFIVNYKNATYEDVISLIEIIKAEVFRKFGIMLEEEVVKWKTT